jgi:hypothetical protein
MDGNKMSRILLHTPVALRELLKLYSGKIIVPVIGNTDLIEADKNKRGQR